MTSISGGDAYDVLGGSPLVEGGGIREAANIWNSNDATALKVVRGLVGVACVLVVVLAFVWLVDNDGADANNKTAGAMSWIVVLAFGVSLLTDGAAYVMNGHLSDLAASLVPGV